MNDSLDVQQYDTAPPAPENKSPQQPAPASTSTKGQYLIMAGEGYPEDEEDEDWEPLEGWHSAVGVVTSYSRALDCAIQFNKENQWWQIIDLTQFKIILTSDEWAYKSH